MPPNSGLAKRRVEDAGLEPLTTERLLQQAEDRTAIIRIFARATTRIDQNQLEKIEEVTGFVVQRELLRPN